MTEASQAISQWCDFVGFEGPLAMLRRTHQERGLPASSIVQGRNGTGKRTLAAAMAAMYFCETRNACGHCGECRQIATKSQADVLWVDTEEAQLKLAEAQEIQEHLQMKPFHLGGRRIAIVVNADRLNRQSANRLLKLIEEPAADSMIILTTSRPRAMLPTILSRCVKVRLSVPPRDEAWRYLCSFADRNALDFDESQIREVLDRCGGSIGRAKAWLSDHVEDELSSLFDEVFGSKSGSSTLKLYAAIENLERLKLSTQELAKEYEYWLNKTYRQNKLTPSFIDPLHVSKRREILSYLKKYPIAFNARLNIDMLSALGQIK